MKNIQGLLYLTPKATFYNAKEEVIDEGLALHDALFNEDRELYAYLLYFQNATYYSKSLFLTKLLGNSLHKEKFAELRQKDPALLKVEDALIRHTLFNENITHALKMLLALKKFRINNKRTTNHILTFIFDRDNADFIAIKYKNKIKQLLVHALGLKSVHDILERRAKGDKIIAQINKLNPAMGLEVFDFVFDVKRQYTSPYLQEYVAVRDDFANGTVNLTHQTNLPIEVLIGFNNYYQRGLNIPALISAANISTKQKIQLQNTVKRHSNNTMELKLNFNDYSLLDLYKYLYNKEDLSEAEQQEIQKVIQEKVDAIRDEFYITCTSLFEDAYVIVDCSLSHSGSSESMFQPLYKNLILARVLQNGDNVLYVGGTTDERGNIVPAGDTDLASALLEAVERGAKNIVVLSDGFENVGSFDKVHQQLLNIGCDLNVVHFNPVFSPKNFSFKTIGEKVVTVPYQNEKDIANLQLFYLLATDKEQCKKVLRETIEMELFI